MNIPSKLLKEAVKASGSTTKTEAVVLGLKELIHKKNIQNILLLKGSGKLGLTQKQLSKMRAR
ncbi:type II toxin-antitoxin system VapB family antitoxin [bacterium]|nr:type II toxin-antitoxin system VapB family antitoxin [bacterium]